MDKMDLVAFFRVAIPVVLAVFSVGLILVINVIFIGNACYVLKNCFKREKNMVISSKGQNKMVSLRFKKSEDPKEILPKAS